MADNTTINAGSGGDVIATDDIAGVKHQLMKVEWGAADSATQVADTAAAALPVKTRVSALTQTTGTITTSASTVTATTDIPNAGTVTVFIYGTYAGVNATFEVSPDGTNWVPVTGQRMDTQQLTTSGATGVLTANLSVGYDIPIPGPAQFRVRATAYTSGTANVVIAPAVNAFEIAPSVSLNDASASGSLTAAAQAVTIQPLNGASTARVVISGTFSATAAFEGLDSGGNWIALWAAPTPSGNGGMFTFSSTAANTVNTTTTANSYVISVVGFLGVRVRCSAYTSGTMVVALSTAATANPNTMIPVFGQVVSNDGVNPPQFIPYGASQLSLHNGSTWDRGRSVVNAANTTGTGVLAAGILAQLDDVSPTAITENQFGNLRMSALRGLHVAVKTDTVGGATTFTLISAATTNATSVKGSAGTLYELSLGNNGASAAYVKFYNKATAPTVGTDTPVATYYLPPTSGREVPIPPMGLAFGTGIAYAITGVGTVADTTAVAATQVFINGAFA